MSYIIVIILIILVSFLVDVYIVKRNRKTDGTIVVIIKDDGKKLFSLELDKNPDDIMDGDYILFKVMNEPTEEFE